MDSIPFHSYRGESKPFAISLRLLPLADGRGGEIFKPRLDKIRKISLKKEWK
jgi:hypothetical protein